MKFLPIMQSGYAYSSLNTLENVMIGSSEAKSARFAYYVSCDNQTLAAFRIGRKLFYQLPSVYSKIRIFTLSDVQNTETLFPRIYADRSELVDNPTDWQKRGLSQTASGYGSKLNSGLSIYFEGKLRRIYVTCYSNAGSSWFKFDGRKIYVD